MKVLTPVFVEFIPETLEEGKIYISQTYATAAHKCCCGCGHKVVTPLSPTGWRLTVDGEHVSLYPSIGNWGFPCRSHYWIRRNVVHWSYEMSQREIEAGRRQDARLRERYYSADGGLKDEEPTDGPAERQDLPDVESLWNRLKRWLFG